MGLLDDTTQRDYYQGNDYGNYQFVSLDDIITQFQIMYVGEDKLIPKAKRVDIAFHAQRALAELSFDTFKSFKSQQIDLPPSLTMILPHDYVNYTKVSWVDGAGIKRPVYPTRHTSNPFQIKQEEGGEYSFPVGYNLVNNGDFASDFPGEHWNHSPFSLGSKYDDYNQTLGSDMAVSDGKLTFTHSSHDHPQGEIHGKAQAAWQQIDVSEVDFLVIEGKATTSAASTMVYSGTTYNLPSTTVRLGISTTPGSDVTAIIDDPDNTIPSSPNATTEIFDVDYIEWTDGSSTTKIKANIDVSQYDSVYVLVTSIANFAEHPDNQPLESIFVTTDIDTIIVTNMAGVPFLVSPDGNEVNSSTWNKYKSSTTSENAVQDYRYEENLLKPNERYGLSPEHAQTNGTFYIDQRLGRIHFSSNISGKTVILDYISDSLGTDSEMQVPKLAEDAMYKHILCDMMSARANVGAGRLSYYKKDKFAAVRKAKLRLSNIKLEELSQILRGQSKHIKH